MNSMTDSHDIESGEMFTRAAAELFRQSLSRFGGQWRRVVTNSMYPVIGIGDLILVEAIVQEDLKRGDIVLFYRHDFIVHRILKIDQRNSCIHEKGDGVPHVGVVPCEDIIGRVSKIRKANTVIDLAAPGIKVRNALLTWHSLAQLFWFRHIHGPKTRIVETFPPAIRTPLHRTVKAVRNLLHRITPFGEPPWYKRTENIAVGGQTISVSIASDNRDIGLIVDIMRREALNHPVLCLFMNGITGTLLQYFATIEHQVLLFDKTGSVLDSIEDMVNLGEEQRCNVEYVLILPKNRSKKLELAAGATLVIPHETTMQGHANSS